MRRLPGGEIDENFIHLVALILLFRPHRVSREIVVLSRQPSEIRSFFFPPLMMMMLVIPFPFPRPRRWLLWPNHRIIVIIAFTSSSLNKVTHLRDTIWGVYIWRERTQNLNARLCTRNVHSVCSCVSECKNWILQFCANKKEKKTKKKTKIFHNNSLDSRPKNY